ncbi:hypothetical protein A1Q2_08416 [Trichosporon asahii var. asahii CBS 8904]|uniref:Uncharacterized protein n=1 Tax=Trichosporon asahii var. asahii (strain CBS 8904) TaxID=1220162 RepID=K1W658_TRIAC|nr:hypothetical protein A1Q2_08416 [Trichosporon asahii var. asahii CBS 8904]
MLKTLIIATITAASANAVAVPAFQPHEILTRALPEFPAGFGYHLLPRQVGNSTATATGSFTAASGSSTSAVASTTSSAPRALVTNLPSSGVRPGCEEQCKSWLQIIRSSEWRSAEATRSSVWSVYQKGAGPQILCSNLDTASTCGFCNAGPEHKDEMTKGIQALYKECKKLYHVPEHVQGVNGANTRTASAAIIAVGIAAALWF